MQRQNQVRNNDQSGNSASREENRTNQELGQGHGKPQDEQAVQGGASQKREEPQPTPSHQADADTSGKRGADSSRGEGQRASRDSERH